MSNMHLHWENPRYIDKTESNRQLKIHSNPIISATKLKNI